MGDASVLKRRGYTLGSSLGEGSYAKVKSAFSERLQTQVAIKIIDKKNAPTDILEKFLPRELEILATLDHGNIVKMLEIFEISNRKVYMVMELGAQGDLLDLIKLKGALSQDLSRKLFGQLSKAVKFIHDLDMVHRDLKCENLLLDNDFNLKVSDFGFSRRVDYDDLGKMVLSRTFCGSAAYAAPEVLQGIPYNPKLHDVWSMGVVLFIMVCGSMPYDDSNIKQMIKVQWEQRLEFPNTTVVPQECKGLIYGMLQPDVAQRLEIDTIVGHSWLQVKANTQGPGRTDQEEPSTSKAQSKKQGKAETKGGRKDKKS